MVQRTPGTGNQGPNIQACVFTGYDLQVTYLLSIYGDW